MSDEFVVACFGDVVGSMGREALIRALPSFRAQHQCDLIVVNAENAAGGVGATPAAIEEMKRAGVDCFTLGDHTFKFKELRSYLDSNQSYCIRPANYPEGAPGVGYCTLSRAGLTIGICNLMGRVFMNGSFDCPFRFIDRILTDNLAHCDLIVVDFHAEATSEKLAMARYLDGRCTLLVGSHTHVQTADEQVLPGGLGYLTDLGMCGVTDGVIGMDKGVALERFISGLPKAYKLATGSVMLHGAIARIDKASRKALSVERIKM
ncbi:MAG: YmdB family metallophosphoesterase [Bdellovibrionales bacterium]|nr:YmdB family metallophosphoesterase [Bdellovibrionales bacterium]